MTRAGEVHPTAGCADPWSVRTRRALAPSLLRPPDLVPFKPGTDVTFLGMAHAPDGVARPTLDAAIQVGELAARVRASGPREWVAEGDGWALSPPEPAVEVPLCYTLVSGGRLIGDPDGAVEPHLREGAMRGGLVAFG